MTQDDAKTSQKVGPMSSDKPKAKMGRPKVNPLFYGRPKVKGKPRGRPFQKGQIGNPLGITKAREKTVTKQKFEQILKDIMNTPAETLNEVVKQDPSAAKTLVAAAMINGIKSGDLSVLFALADRVFGKPKERVEITTGDRFENLSEQELLEEARRISSAILIEPKK